MKKTKRTKLIALFMAAGMAAAGAAGTVASAAEAAPSTDNTVQVVKTSDAAQAENTETETPAEETSPEPSAEPTVETAEENAEDLASSSTPDWTAPETRPEQSETVTVAPGTAEQQAETPAENTEETTPADTSDETEPEETDNTNWDVFYDQENDTFNLTYNITEDAEGDQVVDLTNALDELNRYTDHKEQEFDQRVENGEDMWDVYDEYIDFMNGNTSNVVQPGDNRKFNVSITTDSPHTYKYKDGSFVLATPDLTNEDNTGITAFDGQELSKTYAGTDHFQLASSSAPIKALLMDCLHWDNFDATNKNTISYAESQTMIQYLKAAYPEVEALQNAKDFTSVLQAYLLHYYSEKDGKEYTDFAKMITESKAANNELYTGTQSNRKLQVQKFNVTNTTVANKLVSNVKGSTNGSSYVAAIRDLVNELTGKNYEKTYNTLTKLRNALIKDGYTELADLIKTSTSTSPSTSVTVPVFLALYEKANEAGSAYDDYLTLTGYNAEDFTINAANITGSATATAMTAGGFTPIAPLDPAQNFNNFYQNLISFTYGDAETTENGKLTIGGMDVSRPSWNSDKTDSVHTDANDGSIGSATVGEYMEMADNATWNKVNAYFRTLLKDGLTAEDAAKQAYNFYMAFNVDGELTGNGYQLSKWSWYNSFTLEQMDGKFNLEKVDEEGKKITSDETTFQIWYYDDANQNGFYDEGDAKYFYTATTDANGNSVYGFVRYDESNQELTYTIDTTNGELKIDYAMLKDMIYYLQEVAAPEGYTVDMKVYVICDEANYDQAVAMYASEVDLAPSDLEDIDAIGWLGKIDPKVPLEILFVNTVQDTYVPITPSKEVPEDPEQPETDEDIDQPVLPDDPQNTEVTEEETTEDPEKTEVEITEEPENTEPTEEKAEETAIPEQTKSTSEENETPADDPEEPGAYVQTGDTGNAVPYIVLTTAAAAAAGAGIVALVYTRKKTQG